MWADRSLHLRKTMGQYWQMWLSNTLAQNHSAQCWIIIILRYFSLLMLRGSSLVLFNTLLYKYNLQILNTTRFSQVLTNFRFRDNLRLRLEEFWKDFYFFSCLEKLLSHMNSILSWLQGFITHWLTSTFQWKSAEVLQRPSPLLPSSSLTSESH